MILFSSICKKFGCIRGIYSVNHRILFTGMSSVKFKKEIALSQNIVSLGRFCVDYFAYFTARAGHGVVCIGKFLYTAGVYNSISIRNRCLVSSEKY